MAESKQIYTTTFQLRAKQGQNSRCAGEYFLENLEFSDIDMKNLGQIDQTTFMTSFTYK